MDDFKVGDKVRYSQAWLKTAMVPELRRDEVGTVKAIERNKNLTVPVFLVVDFGVKDIFGSTERVLDARILEVCK